MPVKTRVTGRKGEGVKCIEIGCGAGIIVDQEAIAAESEIRPCKIIKPSSEEFTRMVNAMPNSERLKPQYNPVVFYDKPRLGARKA